ncbi:MAG TPA: DegT/DnrJ/EryC1/StrS family aminotransferase [Stellaceae bacterium]|jgi:dTDP-4-amino-4,6-dideoxygalactose transaminase|nr:DegT/DnrJ/EryC1/StrS family aminotransferase [Stellaceae bacterium]
MSEPVIPQADPRAGYRAHHAEIDAALARMLEGGRYILGPEVEAFEREFAAYIGARHGIGAASGTEALVLALKALDLGPDDYVATVSHTAVATVAAIELAGAKPLLIDIDPATYTIDPAKLETALIKPPGKIAAVIPVHLYGLGADMSAISALAKGHGFRIIEDCAQSHGAFLDGRRLGGIGDLAAFSFYPTKNLGGIGDGGAVLTNDPALAARLKELREYGWRQRYISDRTGMNSRLDEMQAAILRVKLRHLDGDNAGRQAIAGIYDYGLRWCEGIGLPARRQGGTHVFHQYVLRCRDRDTLQAALKARNVGTNIHYPIPVHLQPAYKDRVAVGPGGLRESERAAREILSLPMFPELGEARAARVVAALKEISSG